MLRPFLDLLRGTRQQVDVKLTKILEQRLGDSTR